MKCVCVIPARLKSTRLKEKLLRTIQKKPVIQWVYENAKKAASISRVIVACDNERIKSCVESFGGEAVLTSPNHESGTERISEVARQVEGDIILNVQGDEPLMHPSVMDQVVGVFKKNPFCKMASACIRRTAPDEFSNPSVVKVVKDLQGRALYFSRSPIPHDRDGKMSYFYKHLGIYGYQRSFLLEFLELKRVELEDREKLEQLRVLGNGIDIHLIETPYDSVGVDTEEDLKEVERRLSETGVINA